MRTCLCRSVFGHIEHLLDLSVLIPAAEIAAAGTVQIKVKNGDGQESGTLDFTVT